MSVVLLGTYPALDQVSGEVVVLEGKRITKWETHDHNLQEAMRTISHPVEGFWPRHSTMPPRWVESSDKELEAALAEYYGCPVGRPDDWPAY